MIRRSEGGLAPPDGKRWKTGFQCGNAPAFSPRCAAKPWKNITEYDGRNKHTPSAHRHRIRDWRLLRRLLSWRPDCEKPGCRAGGSDRSGAGLRMRLDNSKKRR